MLCTKFVEWGAGCGIVGSLGVGFRNGRVKNRGLEEWAGRAARMNPGSTGLGPAARSSEGRTGNAVHAQAG